MTPHKTILAFLILGIIGLQSSLATAKTSEEAIVKVLAIDPASGTTLGIDDKVYLRISYQSDVPLRFLATGYHEGHVQEVGAETNSGSLHSVGSGEALVWLGYDNPTHIDEVRINLLDAEWQKLDSVSEPIDMRWHDTPGTVRHQPAPWVEDMSRSEFRKKDYLHDPKPKQYGALSDILFLLTVISAPAYLFVQVQMLRRYHGRWRELAAIPLVTAMPLVIYGAVIGYGIDANLWLSLIFRCTPFALLYLLTLWVIKRLRAGSSATLR